MGRIGFTGVVANIFIALHADRLAHRRRLAAMAEFFEHAVALPPNFLGEQHSGRVMKVMLRGTDQLFSMWLSFFREHLSALVAMIVLIPTAIIMNWQMALLLFGLMLTFTILNVTVVRKTYKAQGQVEQYHSEVASRASDVMGNVTIVQAFTRLSAELQALNQSMSRLLAAQFPVLNWWALLSVLTKAASTITIVSIFALGTFLHAGGKASVGEIVTFVGFATLLIGRLEQLSGFANSIFFQTHPITEFFTLLDAESTIKESPNAPALQIRNGRVEFKNVSFHYPNSSAGVKNVNFVIEPGQTVALVGATGSGKSTLASFLIRIRDPQQGTVLIDGQDLREVSLLSLRQAVGVVFQEAGLFNRSIMENLQIGKPDATQEEIIAAVQKAEAHDFIADKAEGFHTLVTERGQNLSGGERQRLAIARAILKNAPVLILDEATSALDVETEGKITRALDTLSQNRTTLIIAHRLSTVRKADQIIVLKDGAMVESGKFDELIAQNGIFANFAKEGGLVSDDTALVKPKKAKKEKALEEPAPAN